MNPMRTLCLLAALFAATAASAQKLAPGLWEHTVQMKLQGGQADAGLARMQEQLARMSPEQRQQMEAMMAARGGGGPGMAAGLGMMAGKPSVVKTCITPEQAARDEIPQAQGHCQQVSQERSGKTIKFKFACQAEGPGSMAGTGEGQYTLLNDKALSGHMMFDGTARNGQAIRMDMEQTGRWLAADCGDVKPRPDAKR
jgi:hypothetical protein